MTPKSLLFSLALPVLATPALAEIPADWADIPGLYGGSYLCEDGEHGVLLEIALTERAGGAGLQVDGLLAFFPVIGGRAGEMPEVAGSFEFLGLLTEDGELRLRAGDWIVQPEGYGAAGFRGEITRRADGLWQITGRPLAGPTSEYCSDLVATKALP